MTVDGGGGVLLYCNRVMDMALSEAKKAADKRYNAKLDQIMIRPYKEKGVEIRRAAKARGMSIQAYILEAVQMRMDREAGLSETVETPARRSMPEQPVLQAGQSPAPERRKEQLPIEQRVPLERLGTEVLKLSEEESGQEILRLERAVSGVNLMMLFCNMTAAERTEWKRRRTVAYSQRKTLLGNSRELPENDLPF